jgi:tetratricopeptide (TPR) repeat protein
VQQQAEACRQLASIYSQNGTHDKAVEYYEKNYELARSTGQVRRLFSTAMKPNYACMALFLSLLSFITNPFAVLQLFIVP